MIQERLPHQTLPISVRIRVAFAVQSGQILGVDRHRYENLAMCTAEVGCKMDDRVQNLNGVPRSSTAGSFTPRAPSVNLGCTSSASRNTAYPISDKIGLHLALVHRVGGPAQGAVPRRVGDADVVLRGAERRTSRITGPTTTAASLRAAPRSQRR